MWEAPNLKVEWVKAVATLIDARNSVDNIGFSDLENVPPKSSKFTSLQVGWTRDNLKSNHLNS